MSVKRVLYKGCQYHVNKLSEETKKLIAVSGW